MNCFRFVFVFIFLLSSFSVCNSTRAQTLPITESHQEIKAASVEIYGALPDARAVRLSPDGGRLALIMPHKGRNALVIWDLDKYGKTKVIPTGEFEPKWIMWKSDSRLIAALVVNPEVSYPARVSHINRRAPFTRIIAFDADGEHMKDLVSGHRFKEYLTSGNPLVSLLANDKDHILISMGEVDYNMGWQHIVPELFKVDVNTGNLENLTQNEKYISTWTADTSGNPRLKSYCKPVHKFYCEDKTITFQIRNSSDNTWQTIQTIELDKPKQFYPVAFVDNTPDRLYVLSNQQEGQYGLYEFDTTSKSFLRPIVSSPQYIAPIKSLSDRLIGYRMGEHAPIYIDAAFAKEAQIINRALPDSINDIVDISEDHKRVLVKVTKGNEPTDYWLLDRSSGKTTLSPIADNYPKLKSSQIAPTQIVSYKSRDGLDIPALLTLPLGYHSGPNSPALPFVVLPHDGPTDGDVRGFNFIVQFLTSRGYGVLQPQFRGSTGYSEALKLAEKQQWGLAMQNDITDGTKWLVQQKLADSARIAIVGTSGYGGYAALMGAIKEPTLYRCAAAFSPITDLELLRETREHYLFNDDNMPGSDTDVALLRTYSPTHNADKIGIPILLVHGRKDFTVPVDHTEEMSKSLSLAGKAFEVLYLKEADHYFGNADDRIAMLTALDKFLFTHLAGQSERTSPAASLTAKNNDIHGSGG